MFLFVKEEPAEEQQHRHGHQYPDKLRVRVGSKRYMKKSASSMLDSIDPIAANVKTARASLCDPMTLTKNPNSVSPRRDFIILDVGGRTFVTNRRHFNKFPHSRLWQLMKADNAEECLEFCDAYNPDAKDEKDLNKNGKIAYYFFDHGGSNFEMILDLYRNGCLHVSNKQGCPNLTKCDLDYWGIDQYEFESCCALKYHQNMEQSKRSMEEMMKLEVRAEEEDENEEDAFGEHFVARFRRWIWDITEYPESSLEGKIFAVVTLIVIFLSVAVFLTELIYDFDNLNPVKMTNGEVRAEKVLGILEIVTVAFFTVEYLARLLCTPKLSKFLLSWLNLADLLAILPFFVSVLMYELQAFHLVGKAGKLIHLIRILRVFRMFTLVRHVQNLKTLLVTVRQAMREIGLILVIYVTALVTASTVIHYCEKNEHDELEWTFFTSIWWAVMTFSTIGYNTPEPKSAAGRITGGIFSIVSIFLVTLHVPIVVSCFTRYYKNKTIRSIFWSQREKMLKERKRSRGTSFLARNASFRVTPPNNNTASGANITLKSAVV